MVASNDSSPTVCLEVIGGPLDGLRYEGRHDCIQMGRSDGAGPDKVRNDLVLQRDSYSSSFHCQLYLEDGMWLLCDKGSTNGTWSAGKKLKPNEPVAIAEGEVFVVGNSVMRFRTQPSGMPPIDPNLVSILSAASQTMLNRARAIAKDQQTPWVGTSFFFQALVESKAPPLSDFFEHAGIDPDEAIRILKDWHYWSGELEWIGREVLRGRRTHDRLMRGIRPTPRMQLIVTLADRVREEVGAHQIEPIHLLAGIFREPGNHVVLSLRDAGHEAEQLSQIAMELIRPPEPEPTAPPEPTERMAPPKPTPSAPPRRQVDPETWLIARNLMEKLQSVQTEFNMAEAEMRFEALCNAVREGLQNTPPNKRAAAADQLFFLFPVLEDALLPPPPMLSEATPHSREMLDEETDSRPEAEAREGVATAPSSEAGADFDTGVLMRKVFGGDKAGQTLANVDEENPFLRLSQHLYSFALDMERLAKGLVQSVQGGGGSESRYFLPFTARDLKMMIEKLLDGDEEEAVRDIRLYLYDLGHWIIALIAAHQKAANQWNQELWDKISPQAIRNEARVSSINKALGQGNSELWKVYERISRDLRPEITEDLLNEKIGQLATEEFRRLSQTR